MDTETIGADLLDEWLKEVAGEDSVSAIARKVGMPQRTLANHVKSGDISAREVIAIARAYDYPVIFALEQLGFVTTREVVSSARDYARGDMAIRDLLVEALNRLDRNIGSLDHVLDEGDMSSSNVDWYKYVVYGLYQDYVRGAFEEGADYPPPALISKINVSDDDLEWSEEELRQAAAHHNPDRRREAEGREDSI